MKVPAPKGVAQRVLTWWNARKGREGGEGSTEGQGGSAAPGGIRQTATQIGGELRGATREVGLRGKDAIDRFRHRGEAKPGVESREIRGVEPATRQSGQQGGSTSQAAAKGGETSGLTAPPRTDATATGATTGSVAGAAGGASSAVWGSGVVDTSVGVPGTSTGERPAEASGSAADAGPEGSVLGAASDDGSSISEIEADPEPGTLEPGLPSTTLAADAYRSTTAPEEVEMQSPQPGSTIPDFATDSESASRVVEEGGQTTDRPDSGTGERSR